MGLRVREEVLLASGARTTTQTLGARANPDQWGSITDIEIVLDLTAFTTAASLTLSIEEYNEGSGAWRSVLAASALAATGVARLRVGPNFATTANVALQARVGAQWRVVVTHGNANSHTYSVMAKIARDVG